MQFKQWLENHWYDFKETVTLYHGTSTAFTEDIKRDGLKPPQDDLLNYGLQIAKRYMSKVPPALIKKIKEGLLIRTDTNNHQLFKAIYLTPDFKGAAGYAQAYYKYGGEIAHTIWREINIWKNKEQGVEITGNNDPILIQPIHQHHQPIVLEIEISWNWMKTFHDLRKKFDRAVTSWEDYEKTHYEKEGKTFNDYIHNWVEDFEIRVTEPIPPNMIKNIHPITAVPTTS